MKLYTKYFLLYTLAIVLFVSLYLGASLIFKSQKKDELQESFLYASSLVVEDHIKKYSSETIRDEEEATPVITNLCNDLNLDFIINIDNMEKEFIINSYGINSQLEAMDINDFFKYLLSKNELRTTIYRMDQKIIETNYEYFNGNILFIPVEYNDSKKGLIAIGKMKEESQNITVIIAHVIFLSFILTLLYIISLRIRKKFAEDIANSKKLLESNDFDDSQLLQKNTNDIDIKSLNEEIIKKLDLINSEKLLKQEKELEFLLLMNHIDDGLGIIDYDTDEFIYMNEAFKKICKDKIQIGDKLIDFAEKYVVSEDINLINNSKEILIVDKLIEFPIRYSIDGEDFKIYVKFKLHKDRKNRTKIYGFFKDISKEENKDFELNKYRVINDYFNDAYFSLRPDASIRSMNKSARKLIQLLGYDEYQIKLHEIFSSDFKNEFKQNILSSYNSKPLINYVCKIVNKNSEEIIASISIFSHSLNTGFIDDISVILSLKDDRTNIERALKKSKSQFMNLVEATGTGVFVINIDGEVIDANQHFLEMINFKHKHELIGQNLHNILLHDDIEELGKFLRVNKLNGYSNTYTFRFVKPDKSLIYIEFDSSYEDAKGGAKIHILAHDITTKKNAEIALRDQEKLNSIIFNSSPLGYVIASMDGVILKCNSHFAKITGRNIQECISLNLWDFTPLKYTELEKEKNEALKKYGTYGPYEKEYIHKNGKLIPVKVNTKIIEQNNKQVIWAIIEDLSVGRKAQSELTENLGLWDQLENINNSIHYSPNLYETIQNVLSESLRIFSADRAWLLYAADPKEEYWSVPFEKFVKDYPGAFIVGKDIPMTENTRDVIITCNESSTPIIFNSKSEFDLPTEVKEEFKIKSMMCVTVRPKEGKPWIFGLHQCSFEKIWEGSEINLFNEIGSKLSFLLNNLLLQKNIKISDSKIQSIIDSSPGVVFSRKPDKYWTTKYIHKSIYEITGYSANDFLSSEKNYSEIILPEDLQKLINSIENSVLLHESYEVDYRIITKNGELRWVRERGHPQLENPEVFRFNTEASMIINGTITDITKQQNAKLSIQDLNTRLGILLENNPLAIMTFNSEFKIEVWNKAAEKLFGFTKEEIVNKNPNKLIVPESEIKHVSNIWGELMQKKSSNSSLNRNIRKDGKEILCKWHNNRLFDNQGNIVGAISFAQDLTERELLIHKLRENNNYLDLIKNNSYVFFYIMEQNNEASLLSSNFEKFFESKLNENLNIDDYIYDITVNDDKERIKKLKLDLAKDKESKTLKGAYFAYIRVLLDNHEKRIFYLNYIPVKSTDNNISLLVEIHDITQGITNIRDDNVLDEFFGFDEYKLNFLSELAESKNSVEKNEIYDIKFTEYLKSQIGHLNQLTEWLKNDYSEKIDEKAKDILNLLFKRSEKINEHLNRIVEFNHLIKKENTIQICYPDELIRKTEKEFESINLEFITNSELIPVKFDNLKLETVFREITKTLIKDIKTDNIKISVSSFKESNNVVYSFESENTVFTVRNIDDSNDKRESDDLFDIEYSFIKCLMKSLNCSINIKKNLNSKMEFLLYFEDRIFEE